MRDSVDQAPEDIQIQAIEQAQDWLTSEGLTFWRVIIPLWPETYERLLHQNLPPLDHHQLLPLGQVNPDSFLAARRKVQLHAVTNAKQFGPSLDLRSQQRRRRQCKAYLKTAYTILRPTFGNVINNLCASNLRLSGQLWHGMILSKSFYENRQLLTGQTSKTRTLRPFGRPFDWRTGPTPSRTVSNQKHLLRRLRGKSCARYAHRLPLTLRTT